MSSIYIYICVCVCVCVCIHQYIGNMLLASCFAFNYDFFLCIHIAVTLGGHCLIILITTILFATGYDILPVDFSAVPLNLDDDPTKLRTDAWKFASESDSVTLSSSTVGARSPRILRYQGIELVYESRQKNILTKESLKHIAHFEWQLRNSTAWRAKICLLDSKQECQKPNSILRFFDGTYRSVHEGLFDPGFENITKVLGIAQSLNKTRLVLAYHLAKDAVVAGTTKIARSKYTRSLMITGWPLEGYDSTLSQKDEQTEKLDSTIVDAFAVKLAQKYKTGFPSIDFFYYNRAVYVDAIKRQVVYDFLLAGGSMLFIFLFMWMQVGSIWITSWAMFSILSSFVAANFIYRVILDYRYFGVFHVLSVFIILGIGADDVFVFMDSWKQSGDMNFPSLVTRLSYVYRRAASAMFVTSFTTMVAFLSSTLSPLLAVSTFGTFSALLVFVNYCSVILFLPCVVLVHELHRKGKCCFCCSIRKPTAAVHPSNSTSDRELPDAGRPRPQTKIQRINTFLKGSYFEKCIRHGVFRWVVFFTFAAMFATFLTFATFIKPDEKDLSALKHIFQSWSRLTSLHMLKVDACKTRGDSRVFC